MQWGLEAEASRDSPAPLQGAATTRGARHGRHACAGVQIPASTCCVWGTIGAAGDGQGELRGEANANGCPAAPTAPATAMAVAPPTAGDGAAELINGDNTQPGGAVGGEAGGNGEDGTAGTAGAPTAAR